MKAYIISERQERIWQNKVKSFVETALWHIGIAGFVLFAVGYNYFLAMRDNGQLSLFGLGG